MGKTTFVPEGLKEEINVKQLLDGVESEEKRQERQKNRRQVKNSETTPSMVLPISAENIDLEVVAELKRIKTSLDLNAKKHAKWRLWLYLCMLIAVWVGLGVLTYQFGWDKMEPWTYFAGGGVTLGSYTYFAITQRELSPKAIYNQIIETKKRKDYQTFGFDLEKYESLVK